MISNHGSVHELASGMTYCSGTCRSGVTPVSSASSWKCTEQMLLVVLCPPRRGIAATTQG
eukprot:3487311-Prorocentrum_lima.AAC.1